mmetsp:Transcript_11723/g.35773  ORF Transcript_11723/g.35773 Transcript_11723/m.35773 type:complete len:278 (-) Transcript_11723:177-1010(-)
MDDVMPVQMRDRQHQLRHVEAHLVRREHGLLAQMIEELATGGKVHHQVHPTVRLKRIVQPHNERMAHTSQDVSLTSGVGHVASARQKVLLQYLHGVHLAALHAAHLIHLPVATLTDQRESLKVLQALTPLHHCARVHVHRKIALIVSVHHHDTVLVHGALGHRRSQALVRYLFFFRLFVGRQLCRVDGVLRLVELAVLLLRLAVLLVVEFIAFPCSVDALPAVCLRNLFHCCVCVLLLGHIDRGATSAGGARLLQGTLGAVHLVERSRLRLGGVCVS